MNSSFSLVSLPCYTKQKLPVSTTFCGRSEGGDQTSQNWLIFPIHRWSASLSSPYHLSAKNRCKPMYFQKHLITKSKTEITVVVDEALYKAGFDPFGKFIDKNWGDNIKVVSQTAGKRAAR